MMSGFDLAIPNKLPGATTLNCPKCEHKITWYTHAQARNIKCEKCNHLYDIRENGLLSIKQFEQNKVSIHFPIGSKGRLNNVLYQVVGFILYQERDSSAQWREYVLFNPVSGYAFLSEYNGHWNFFYHISDYSHGSRHLKSFTYDGLTFELFHKYASKVVFASGEFFWNINAGNHHYAEYISPPYIITRILSAKEITWLFGKYLEPEEIQTIFGAEKPMPQKIGIGATEPYPSNFNFESIKKISLYALGVLLFFQILFAIQSKDQRLSDKIYELPEQLSTTDPSPITGPSFALNSNFLQSSNLEFLLDAPVSNDWFAVGVTLFNTRTGQEFDIDLGVEYYFGYDGGRWSEGSQHTSELLSALPDGEYKVLIRPYKDNASLVNSFRLEIIHDVAIWSNFWIVLVLVIIFPAFQYYMERNFEKRRWMNSDYSNYEY